jgi:asparagine synthase (glutamine-hydrolysing)
VCLMREALGPDRAIQTFSYAASEPSLDESRWADAVNRFTSAEGHRVAVDDHDWMDLLSETIHAQFEPFGSPSIVAQHAVYRAAGRAGTKVMLDGQGADELFAGYPSFLTEAIGDEVRSGRLLQAFRLMRALSRHSGPASAARALARALPRSLAIALWRSWMDRSAPQWLDVAWFEDRGVRTMSDPATLAKSFDDAVERSQDRTSLPALLRYADRNSMASAVESRVPFLTTELAMLAARLPQHYLISREGTPKQVLRDAMANVVPAEVLARRDKIAFQVPHSVRASMLERSVSQGLQPSLVFLRGVGDSSILGTPLPWAPTNLVACAQRWSLSW